MSITVVQDKSSKRWKVLVDYIQRGAMFSQASTANHEAQRIHDKESPHATLTLATPS